MFVDRFVGGLDMFRRREITFPKLPGIFLDRLLPRDGPDDEPSIVVDVYRLKNIGASRDQIRSEKKILVKTKPLRIYEVDLVPRATIDHEHRMWKSVRRIGMIDARDRIELGFRLYRQEGIPFGVRPLVHRTGWFAGGGGFAGHLR